MKKILFISALLSAMFVSAQNVTPAINVTAGTKLESKIKTETTMSMSVMGQSMDTKSTSTQKSEIAVKEKNSNGYVVANTLKHLAMQVETMRQEMSYDSDKEGDPNNPMAEAAKDKLNKPEDIELDTKGRITKMGNKGEEENPLEAMGGMAVGQQYPFFIPVPGKALKVGDSWSETTGTAETVLVSNTYTLTAINGNTLLISSKGTMKKKGQVNMQGQDMDIDLSGDLTSESEYDKATGLYIKGKGKIAMEGTMSVQGQSIPLTMVALSDLEVQKK